MVVDLDDVERLEDGVDGDHHYSRTKLHMATAFAEIDSHGPLKGVCYVLWTILISRLEVECQVGK